MNRDLVSIYIYICIRIIHVIDQRIVYVLYMYNTYNM